MPIKSDTFYHSFYFRELGSLVELVAQNPLEWKNCTVALQETIPSGLYVNQDQLMDLERQGSVSKLLDINLLRLYLSVDLK